MRCSRILKQVLPRGNFLLQTGLSGPMILKMKTMDNNKGYDVPTMADLAQQGEQPEVLLWIGCAGSFDERYKKVTRAFVKVLHMANVKFGVLGPEETCTGDPARRAGNEFLFQMQAMANIQVLNGYKIKKIVTACPHCYNTIKNEYPDLGGSYEVLHHSEFLDQLLNSGRLNLGDNSPLKGKKITYHDSCYLGRSGPETSLAVLPLQKWKASSRPLGHTMRWIGPRVNN